MLSKALVTLVSRLVIRFDKPDGSSCQLLNRLTSLYLQDVTFPQHEQVRWEIQGVPTKIFLLYFREEDTVVSNPSFEITL